MDDLYIKGLEFSPTGIYVLKLNQVVPRAAINDFCKTLREAIQKKHEGAEVIVLDSCFDVVSTASDEIIEGLGWVKKENEEAVK